VCSLCCVELACCFEKCAGCVVMALVKALGPGRADEQVCVLLYSCVMPA
jgi:hypothetical protein